MGLRDTATPQDGPELTAAAEAIVATIENYSKPVIFAPWINDPQQQFSFCLTGGFSPLIPG